MKFVRFISILLVVIGALNWGLVGVFQFDAVAGIFGGMDSFLARIVYALIGLSGLYCIRLLCHCCSGKCKCGPGCHCKK